MGRLARRYEREVIEIEEHVPVGLKRRTLVLGVDRGKLQALSLSSEFSTEWSKHMILEAKKDETPDAEQKRKSLEAQTVEELLERPTFVQSKDIEVGEKALKVIHALSYKQKVYHEKVS